jgi:hypothetical protein
VSYTVTTPIKLFSEQSPAPPLSAFRPPRYEPSSVEFPNISVYPAWVRSRPTLTPRLGGRRALFGRRGFRVEPRRLQNCVACRAAILCSSDIQCKQTPRIRHMGHRRNSCQVCGQHLAACPWSRRPAEHRQPSAVRVGRSHNLCIAIGTFAMSAPLKHDTTRAGCDCWTSYLCINCFEDFGRNRKDVVGVV